MRHAPLHWLVGHAQATVAALGADQMLVGASTAMRSAPQCLLPLKLLLHRCCMLPGENPPASAAQQPKHCCCRCLGLSCWTTSRPRQQTGNQVPPCRLRCQLGRQASWCLGAGCLYRRSWLSCVLACAALAQTFWQVRGITLSKATVGRPRTQTKTNLLCTFFCSLLCCPNEAKLVAGGRIASLRRIRVAAPDRCIGRCLCGIASALQLEACKPAVAAHAAPSSMEALSHGLQEARDAAAHLADALRQLHDRHQLRGECHRLLEQAAQVLNEIEQVRAASPQFCARQPCSTPTRAYCCCCHCCRQQPSTHQLLSCRHSAGCTRRT